MNKNSKNKHIKEETIEEITTTTSNTTRQNASSGKNISVKNPSSGPTGNSGNTGTKDTGSASTPNQPNTDNTNNTSPNQQPSTDPNTDSPQQADKKADATDPDKHKKALDDLRDPKSKKRPKKIGRKNLDNSGKDKKKPKTPSSNAPGGSSKLDKAKKMSDPKSFAKDQAKKVAKKAIKETAKKVTTKALGSAIGSAIGGPVGTAIGFAAGVLIDVGIDVAEKLIKYMAYVIGIIIVFFALLIFLIFAAIGSFFFAGGGGTSSHQENSIKQQIEPINSPTQIPTGAKSLDKPRSWYQDQKISTGCHCTSVAMYLSFLGFEASEDDICYIYGGDNLKDSVNFGDVEAKYPVTRSGQILDTSDFSKLKQFIIDNIDEGKPLILGVGQPIAYGNSHFIVAVGYDKNYIYLNDPNSSNSNSRKWEELKDAKYFTPPPYHAYTISLTK